MVQGQETRHRSPQTPRYRSRCHTKPRELSHRGPANDRHRPRDRHRRETPGPRRTHIEPRRPGSRRTLHRHPKTPRPRARDPLRVPLYRTGLRNLRPDHDPARRATRRRIRNRQAAPPRYGRTDDRQGSPAGGDRAQDQDGRPRRAELLRGAQPLEDRSAGAPARHGQPAARHHLLQHQAQRRRVHRDPAGPRLRRRSATR